MELSQGLEEAGRSFLGRERELRELGDALAAARERGRLFLLCGEAGIGKTALAERVAGSAAARAFRVAWGRCWESGGAPPYWPWIQVIRHCLPDLDLTGRSDIMSDLAQILPERHREASFPPIAPEQARFRLFESVVTFLRLATNERPLLVLLDDLHWADDASLLLLHFLARELRGLPIVVVGTYREAEARLEPAVSALLAPISREGRILPLSGLSNDEVNHLVSQHTQRRPSERVLAQIQEITEGNPFFVEEVLHLLQTSEALSGSDAGEVLRVPEGVRDVIRRRLERLADPTRALLSVAAVLGREFDPFVIERMQGESALDVLDAAVEAGVLVRVVAATERFRFSHALVCETLYADISPSLRVELHRRAADALLAFWGAAVEDHLDEVAHHFASAASGGGVEAAVDWAVRAGDHALGQLAFETSAAWFNRALDTMRTTAFLTRDGSPAAWMRKRVDLLLRLAAARHRAGDANATNDALLEAIDRSRDLNDPLLLATAVLALGSTRVDRGNVDHELATLLQEAIARLGDGADAMRARLMARLASSFYLLGDDHDRDEISRQAVDLARRSGDVGALASALTARHSVCWEAESSRERLHLASEIVRLAEEAGEPEAALEGLWWRVFDLLELGEIGAAESAISLYEQRAHEARLPTQRWYASVFRTMQALLRGRFEDAERLATNGLAIRQIDGAPPSQFYAAQMFEIRRRQGRLPEIEGKIRAFIQHYPELRVWQSVVALVHVEIGDRKAARQQFDRLAGQDFRDLRQDVNWLPTLAMLAEVCNALADRQRARLLYDLLRPCAGRNVVVVGAINCLGAVDYFLGQLAATMHQWDSAVRHLTAACDAHTRIQAWPLVAYAQLELARVLVRQDQQQRPQALLLADRARATAQNLGMRALDLSTEAELAAMSATRSASFRRDGDHWAVHFQETLVRLKDNRGCLYIAYLLARPGLPVAAPELLAAAGATASSDEQARVAVRKAVTSVLRALAGRHEGLRQYLAERIHTGRLCSYTPDDSAPVTWDVGGDERMSG